MLSALSPNRPLGGEGYTVEMAEGFLPPGTRFELYAGKILVTTPAAQWHSDVQVRVVQMFRDRGLVAGIEVGIRVAPKETRVADIAVFRGERDRHASYFDADQIAIAVEVVSPSTADNDFKDKPFTYAKLGIPEFWRVQEDAEKDERYLVEVFRLDPVRARYVLERAAMLDEIEAEG